MNTVAINDPRIQDVRVTKDEIIVHLTDGRVISVPLAWSWRLSEATPKQRTHFRLIGNGQGVHWPDIDEDISVEGMLRGIPASRPKSKSVDVTARPLRNPERSNNRLQRTPARLNKYGGGK